MKKRSGNTPCPVCMSLVGHLCEEEIFLFELTSALTWCDHPVFLSPLLSWSCLGMGMFSKLFLQVRLKPADHSSWEFYRELKASNDFLESICWPHPWRQPRVRCGERCVDDWAPHLFKPCQSKPEASFSCSMFYPFYDTFIHVHIMN